MRVEGDADRKKIPVIKKRVKYIEKIRKAFKKRW